MLGVKLQGNIVFARGRGGPVTARRHWEFREGRERGSFHPKKGGFVTIMRARRTRIMDLRILPIVIVVLRIAIERSNNG
jgi:hypothetical protein